MVARLVGHWWLVAHSHWLQINGSWPHKVGHFTVPLVPWPTSNSHY